MSDEGLKSRFFGTVVQTESGDRIEFISTFGLVAYVGRKDLMGFSPSLKAETKFRTLEAAKTFIVDDIINWSPDSAKSATG
jgi:hypothetical protein